MLASVIVVVLIPIILILVPLPLSVACRFVSISTLSYSLIASLALSEIDDMDSWVRTHGS